MDFTRSDELCLELIRFPRLDNCYVLVASSPLCSRRFFSFFSLPVLLGGGVSVLMFCCCSVVVVVVVQFSSGAAVTFFFFFFTFQDSGLVFCFLPIGGFKLVLCTRSVNEVGYGPRKNNMKLCVCSCL